MRALPRLSTAMRNCSQRLRPLTLAQRWPEATSRPSLAPRLLQPRNFAHTDSSSDPYGEGSRDPYAGNPSTPGASQTLDVPVSNATSEFRGTESAVEPEVEEERTSPLISPIDAWLEESHYWDLGTTSYHFSTGPFICELTRR